MTTEAEVAAVVERVMYAEGWVCNPADHEDLPMPGECGSCDGARHRTGYLIYEALVAELLLPPNTPPAVCNAPNCTKNPGHMGAHR